MADFKNAWIGWQNFFEDHADTIVANNESTGYPAANLGNWFTFQRYKGIDGIAGDSWYVRVDCGVPRAANYVCIASHTLDGHQIKVQGSNDDSAWSDVFVVTPDATTLLEYNGVALYNGVYYYNGEVQQAGVPAYGPNNMSGRFPTRTYRYWRVWFGAGPAAAPQVGVIALGLAMDFPSGFYGGFPRPNWNEFTDTTNSISERGVFLGRSAIRVGLRPWKVAISHIPHAWVTQKFMPFKEHAEMKPFFFVWEYEDLDTVNGTRNNTDCAYAWAQVGAVPLKDKRFASISIDCEGALK